MLEKIIEKIMIRLYDGLDDYLQSILFKLKRDSLIYKVLNCIDDYIRNSMYDIDCLVSENYGIKGENMYEKSGENLSAQRIIHDLYEN
jgi:hypothetical protein